MKANALSVLLELSTKYRKERAVFSYYLLWDFLELLKLKWCHTIGLSSNLDNSGSFSLTYGSGSRTLNVTDTLTIQLLPLFGH